MIYNEIITHSCVVREVSKGGKFDFAASFNFWIKKVLADFYVCLLACYVSFHFVHINLLIIFITDFYNCHLMFSS